MKEQQGGHERNEEDTASHQIRQGEGVALEVLDVAEEVGVLLSGLGEEAAECRTKDRADTPHEGHEGEGLWLEFPFWHHFCHHGSDDTNVAVPAAHDGTDGDGHGKARGHAPKEEADQGASEAPEDDGLATEPVSCPPPGDGGEALADREDGSCKAGPFCDVVFLHAKACYHLGQIGENRGQGQGLGEPGNGCEEEA